MEVDERAKLRQKHKAAGHKAAETKGPEARSRAAKKAAETKGPEERSRTAKMANWTRKHGKNDAKNPYSKENYYPHGTKPEDK